MTGPASQKQFRAAAALRARCGIDFSCGLSRDCWSTSQPVRLPMPGDSAKDCLFPSCLRRGAARLPHNHSNHEAANDYGNRAIDLKPGMEAQFEDGRAQGHASVQAREGLHWHDSAALARKAAALPSVVLENHTKDFRGSADFQEWGKLVGDCFASPPEVGACQGGS